MTQKYRPKSKAQPSNYHYAATVKKNPSKLHLYFTSDRKYLSRGKSNCILFWLVLGVWTWIRGNICLNNETFLNCTDITISGGSYIGLIARESLDITFQRLWELNLKWRLRMQVLRPIRIDERNLKAKCDMRRE